MRGYGNDDLDEYEDDGFIEHDEEQEEYEEEDGEEEEEEVEEEERKPSKEELDYLEIRQRIKESMRKQMKKESGSATGNSQVRKKLPNDNYGSFFGPSQPVIAQRVIQESKSLLENQHLVARVSNPHLTSKKSPASTKTTARPGVRDRPPKIVNVVKQKVQKLKDMRDYSFLFSEDADLPAPTKEPPPRTVSVPSSDARSAQVSSKSPKSVSSTSRPVLNGQRPHVPTGQQMQLKAGQHKVIAGIRPNSTSANPRKQLGSSTGNGPGRPQEMKSLPSKMPVHMKTPTSNKTSNPPRSHAPTMDRKAPVAGLKKPMSSVQKAPLPRSHSSVSGVQKAMLSRPHSSTPGTQKGPLSKPHSFEQRKELQEPDRARQISKQSVSSSRPPQMKPPKQIQSRAPAQMDRPKKRPARPFEDDDDEGVQAISMIRNMFGYNPKKYANIDEDDSDMEANFADIQKEELRSSKIAREEDERELRLIEEEERRERMRKQAKKRKLSSH